MKVTEEELAVRAVAPRVTTEALSENIACVNYINVGDALDHANAPVHESHELLTLCIMVLKNGFTIVGKSACASPENYQKDIGQRLAYEDAKRQIWALMGYALRDHLTYDGGTYWSQPAADQQLDIFETAAAARGVR